MEFTRFPDHPPLAENRYEECVALCVPCSRLYAVRQVTGWVVNGQVARRYRFWLDGSSREVCHDRRKTHSIGKSAAFAVLPPHWQLSTATYAATTGSLANSISKEPLSFGTSYAVLY